MTAQELEKMLEQVTPGEWWAWCDDSMKWHIHNDANVIVAGVSDARLIALAPTLARRVIAAEKLAMALREAKPRIADMARSWEAEAQLMARINAALAEWEAAQ